jgi:hypothetical protein
MTVKDISKTGIGAYYIGRGMIPVRMSDSLSITLDVTCKVFDRPLHLNCQVKRFNFDENWQGEKGLNRFFLGLHIEEIQSRHEQYWLEGLRKYGDPEKMD